MCSTMHHTQLAKDFGSLILSSLQWPILLYFYHIFCLRGSFLEFFPKGWIHWAGLHPTRRKSVWEKKTDLRQSQSTKHQLTSLFFPYLIVSSIQFITCLNSYITCSLNIFMIWWFPKRLLHPINYCKATFKYSIIMSISFVYHFSQYIHLYLLFI